jgi:hypothetical protein
MYEELYEKVKPIINGTVSKVYSSNKHLDIDELKSEANMVFMYCAEKYPLKTGKFESFLASSLHWRLFEYVQGRGEQLSELVLNENSGDIKEQYCNMSPILDATFQNLSRDVKQLTDIVFNPPQALFKVQPFPVKDNKRISKLMLFRYLRKSLNWKRDRILMSFQEMQKFLKQSQTVAFN